MDKGKSCFPFVWRVSVVMLSQVLGKWALHLGVPSPRGRPRGGEAVLFVPMAIWAKEAPEINSTVEEIKAVNSATRNEMIAFINPFGNVKIIASHGPWAELSSSAWCDLQWPFSFETYPRQLHGGLLQQCFYMTEFLWSFICLHAVLLKMPSFWCLAWFYMFLYK